jgi:hypothetical protein
MIGAVVGAAGSFAALVTFASAPSSLVFDEADEADEADEPDDADDAADADAAESNWIAVTTPASAVIARSPALRSAFG